MTPEQERSPVWLVVAIGVTALFAVSIVDGLETHDDAIRAVSYAVLLIATVASWTLWWKDRR